MTDQKETDSMNQIKEFFNFLNLDYTNVLQAEIML